MSFDLFSEIARDAQNAASELCESAGLKAGQSVIVGCSTSEVAGHKIGSSSNSEIGFAIFDAIHSVFSQRGVHIAVQCCEHLNRAVIAEREAATGFQIVNVLPTPEAGGAFATAAYYSFKEPVALESFEADAGLDIGGTLIGMHLKRVAVPVRLAVKHIGKAALIAARTRPPLIGGERAAYDETLM